LFGSCKYWPDKCGCQKVFCHFTILRPEITSAMPLVPFSVNIHPSTGHAAASVATNTPPTAAITSTELYSAS
jgi:hypothetical protein